MQSEISHSSVYFILTSHLFISSLFIYLLRVVMFFFLHFSRISSISVICHRSICLIFDIPIFFYCYFFRQLNLHTILNTLATDNHFPMVTWSIQNAKTVCPTDIIQLIWSESVFLIDKSSNFIRTHTTNFDLNPYSTGRRIFTPKFNFFFVFLLYQSHKI